MTTLSLRNTNTQVNVREKMLRNRVFEQGCVMTEERGGRDVWQRYQQDNPVKKFIFHMWKMQLTLALVALTEFLELYTSFRSMETIKDKVRFFKNQV